MLFSDDEASAARFANEFLVRYTAIGFGALSKREVDLMLLQLLQKHLTGFKDKTDFDAALLLRMTKRRLRGLRDELAFRDAQNESNLKQQLRQELKRAEVLAADHSRVMIQLDDAVLRGFAEKIIRSEFGIVDRSFNSAVMQFSGENFLLLAFSVLEENEKRDAEQAVRSLQAGDAAEAEENKSAFIMFRDAFITGAGNQAGKLCVSGALALATGGASIILETTEPATEIGRGIGRALRDAWNHFTGDRPDEIEV
ncbi:hypothetical protein [Roseibium sp.]|uniref:hypothetical protein n=1 Tax=Roseibium sp. TaxID=1936156 RepID=UPI003B501295